MNGTLQAVYECHCAVCERPALGLGRNKNIAIDVLKSMGWQKINSKWTCPCCIK